MKQCVNLINCNYLLLPSKLRLGAGDFPSRDPTEATSDVANKMLIGLPSKGTPLYCFMAEKIKTKKFDQIIIFK